MTKPVFNGHLLEHLLAYVVLSTPRKKMFFVSDSLKMGLGLNRRFAYVAFSAPCEKTFLALRKQRRRLFKLIIRGFKNNLSCRGAVPFFLSCRGA